MKDIIKTLIFEWKKKELPEIFDRDSTLQEYSEIKPPKIIVLSGFRRVGKTYLVFQFIKELLKKIGREQAVYLNFEDERIPLRTEFLTDLIPAIKEISSNEIKFLFLDELQNIPNWSKWARRIYDNERIRLFITGSSSKLSNKEIPTELRGRFLEIKVFPLSFKEFLEFKKIKIDSKELKYSKNSKAELIRNLNEYIIYGSLPEIILSVENKKFEIAQQYYQTVVRRDIIERFKIENEEGLKAMLRLLLNSTNYSISKTYDTLKSLNYEIGKTTLQHYLKYVENSYFIFSLPIFSFKIKDQMQYPRKIYFIDNVFINALSTKFSKDLGRLYENAVAIDLLRKNSGKDLEVFYWKNYLHEEVDFVIKEGFKIKKLIQVCYDLEDIEIKKREVRALIKASKELRCNNLFIITRDYESEEKFKSKKIKFVPIWKWLLES